MIATLAKRNRLKVTFLLAGIVVVALVIGFHPKATIALAGILIIVISVWIYNARRLPTRVPVFKTVEDKGALSYPLVLCRDDPNLSFPAAEGLHPEMESDTWFLEGIL